MLISSHTHTLQIHALLVMGWQTEKNNNDRSVCRREEVGFQHSVVQAHTYIVMLHDVLVINSLGHTGQLVDITHKGPGAGVVNNTPLVCLCTV